MNHLIKRALQASILAGGLWVVGQIVTAMEGTIVVDDAEGGGSVFTVTLPRSSEAKLP